VELSLVRNERAYESVPLLVAGAKDEASAGLVWRAAARETFSARSWVSRYHTQVGTGVGVGRGSSVDAVHVLRREDPDWTVRLNRTLWHFDARDLLLPEAAPLVPAGTPATAAFFMPQSFRLWGVNLAWGTGGRDAARRAPHPFFDIGRSVNSLSGAGYNWLLGVAGSVLGGDLLSVAWQRSEGANGTSAALAELRLRYVYYFGPH
jgi:hypothetical protein